MRIAGGVPVMRPDQANQGLSRAGSGPAPQSNIIQARVIIVSGPGEGIFSYSPTPGPDNLIASTGVAMAGTDPFGNRYLTGDTTYGFGFGIFFAMQLTSAGVIFYIGGAHQSSPYIQTVRLGQNALNPGVTLQSAVTAGPSFGISDGGLSGQIRQLWIAPSGDVTGATDPANVQAALAVVTSPSANSVVYLLAGTWYGNTAVTMDFGQHIIGGGFGNTIWNNVAAGAVDSFRITHAGAYSTSNIGGGCQNFTIDGTSAGAGSTGIHAGDIESLNFDGMQVRNFTGAGSIGYHFDNSVHFTERMSGTIRSNNNTNAVVFDVTGATTSTNSFARLRMDIYISNGAASNNGVVLQNGALIYDAAELGIWGNFPASASGGGSVLTLTGTVPAGHPGAGNPSRILPSTHLNIGVESSSGVAIPATITFGASGNFIDANGALNFGTSFPFTSSNIGTTGSQFRFNGPIIGDSTLVSTRSDGTVALGAIVNNQLLLPNSGGVVSVNPAGAVTGIKIGAAARDSQHFWIKNLSAFTVTFAAAGTSNVAAGVGATVPALTNREFIYDTAAALWYGGA